MFALRRSVVPVSRSVRAFSVSPMSLKGSKEWLGLGHEDESPDELSRPLADSKEAAFAAAADVEEYERSFGEGASENKANDTAQNIANKIEDAAKKAAAEADAQVQSYQDAELGLPQSNPLKKDK
ncbi:hypothetical protein A1Q1_06806 [Trichosporon asahii var. asahii CBS 2479]|uniref:Uncharacterized protein n=1 Tax=Trichosporon asahii var. asahii (strain ATCC 90039 / CBS 2479 / JCM 2466 / KCTC 7840 / NBRC 103889/ NCYC 2677 / UAMH 7654) TaxID=1186058 RepID=J6F9J8_TRIAS|nr:hypothetical protein A1Q1_06806 [Trichosporon asahii var. asahii CBS 2479]EJT51937.1 hypothetical protein A1Q1_06806 [Trichosporon asahii var. asahii CBS 2479]